MRRRSRELIVPQEFSPEDEFSSIGERCLKLAMDEHNLGLGVQRSLLLTDVEHNGRKNLKLDLIASFIHEDESDVVLRAIRAHWRTPTFKTIDHNAIFRHDLKNQPTEKLYADMTTISQALAEVETLQAFQEAA